MADGWASPVRVPGGVRDRSTAVSAADTGRDPPGDGAGLRPGRSRPAGSAHRLRHTLATEMLRAGASLPEVGQVLRHRSQLSTAIYAKVDQDALRPLARRWPGAG